MLGILAGILSFVLLPMVFAADPPSIVGRWYSEIPVDHRGTLYEFRADGRATRSTVSMNEFAYLLEGRMMKTRTPGSVGEPLSEYQYEIRAISATKLTVKPVLFPALTYKFTRDGNLANADQLLLGTWNRKLPDENRFEIWAFREDGRAQIWRTINSHSGKYHVNAGDFHLRIPGAPRIDGTFGWDGDALLLPEPGGGRERYFRY